MFMEILLFSPPPIPLTDLHVNSMKARMMSGLFDAPAAFFHGGEMHDLVVTMPSAA